MTSSPPLTACSGSCGGTRSPPRVSPVSQRLELARSAPRPRRRFRRASAATPPMWSTSVWVTRIPAVRAPSPASSSRSGVGSSPGIDHRRLRRAPLRADDVAVRLERSHHEAVDDEGHDERLSVGVYASAVQRWDLLAPAAPNGTRDPIVLHSDDAARAVLIVLQPGQELGEHQVKENAWVTVVDGEVDVACGGGVVSGGPGNVHAVRRQASGTPCAASTVRACCCCSRRGPARATTRATSASASWRPALPGRSA